MESKINKVIKLETGDKYVILRQAIYKNEVYYIAAKLDNEDNPNVCDLFFFREVKLDGKEKVEKINDVDLIKYLYSYMKF